MKEKQKVGDLELIEESELMAMQVASGKPMFVKQEFSSIQDRVDRRLGAMLDAKPPELFQQEAELLDLDRWSKVFARLNTRKELKVDANITALGVLGMFPVAVRDNE